MIDPEVEKVLNELARLLVETDCDPSDIGPMFTNYQRLIKKSYSLGAKRMQERAAKWADEMSAKVAPHCRTNTEDNFGWGMAEIAYKNAAEAIRSWKMESTDEILEAIKALSIEG